MTRPPRLPFLTARWSNLAILSYALEPRALEPHLPPGCRPDTREGRAFVSLVAFDFLDTRVLGVPWPGFRDFPEINLRFYVRHGEERGVCFVREFVPRRLVAWLARALYNEPYRAAPMRSRTEEGPGEVAVRHTLRAGGREHTLSVRGLKPPVRPPEESLEHFLKEHRWGFGKTRGGALSRYEVVHPTWEVYPVRSVDLNWDWSLVYGPEWAFLGEAPLCSSLLAAGSEVRVYPKKAAAARGAGA